MRNNNARMRWIADEGGRDDDGMLREVKLN